MPPLSPELQQQVQPLLDRWSAFMNKVFGRVQEVLAEANGGLDQLIAEHATDHQPMGAAMNALKARFDGIGTKVDEGWEKCDELLDQVMDQDDLPEAELEALGEIWDQLSQQHSYTLEQVELQYYFLEMSKNAQWARKLLDLAFEEIQKPLRCSQCGADFPNPVYWQASTVNCPFCQAVNDVQPGMAAGLFYQGLGVHALSHEGAWNEWMAEQAADKAYKGKRHGSEADFQGWLAAARVYYTKYYEVTQSVNPGFEGPIEQAVEAKLKHYTAHDLPAEQNRRAFFQQLLDTAANGDPNALGSMVQQLPGDIDLDECGECLVEHGQRQGALVVLQVQHREEGEDEPFGPWSMSKLQEIAKTVSST